MENLRRVLRMLGVVNATIIFTAIIMSASFGIASFIIVLILKQEMNLMLSLISIAIPAVVVPSSMPFFFILLIRLDKTEEKLREFAKMDSLTKIFNRHHIMETLTQEMLRIDRYGGILSVAIFDVDDFKKINDTCGHVCGDVVLKNIVLNVQKTLRSTDSLGRYGGEEFLIVLPHTTQFEAGLMGQRIREMTASSKIEYLGRLIPVSISIGSAQYIPGETLEELINRADQIMYEFKRVTKNSLKSSRKIFGQ